MSKPQGIMNGIYQMEVTMDKSFLKEYAELKAENKQLLEAVNKYGNLQNKYYLMLQEIKEIAEENKDTAQYGGICRSILQKIAECEVE